MNAIAPRGLMMVRAEAAPGIAEVKALIENVNMAFAEFKAANEQRLAEIEKRGAPDPVTAQKVEKLEAAVAEAQKAVDDANRRMAALTVGGAQPGDTPEARQHREAFAGFLRGRIEARTTTYSDPDPMHLMGPLPGALWPLDDDRSRMSLAINC